MAQDVEKLYSERCRIFRDAISFRKPERIPFLSNQWTWKFQDAGFSVGEAARDYDKLEQTLDHFFSTYKVDVLLDVGVRNPFRITDALGGSTYVDDENTKLNVDDGAVIAREDYDILVEDYGKMLWEKALFNKFPSARNMSIEDFAKASEEFKKLIDAKTKMLAKARNEYGVHINNEWIFVGYELLFNWFRGIKGIANDIRKDPGKVKAAIAALDAIFLDPYIEMIRKRAKGQDANLPFDMMSLWLGHTIISSKQFGEFYWPSMKKLFDLTIEMDKQMFIFSEGNWQRFADFVTDYPKGHIAMQVELDDIYALRKAAPNICLSGGLNVDVMGHGTPQECVEMAKRVINDLGCDGGLILSENKMCSYPNDTRSENLKAVADFVSGYYL
jgi:hypothetical protein